MCEVYCRTIVAEAELDAGHHAPALEHLQQAEERSLVTGERFILPQVYLLRARLANERDPKNADAFLGRALDLVRQQGAHGLRARIESEARKLRALRFHPTPVEQERRTEASEA